MSDTPRRRAWNSTLPASDTPLPRGKRMRARSPKTGGHRFPRRRDPKYTAWIRTLDCVLNGEPGDWHDGTKPCAGRIECAHVQTRGAGGYDRANCVPLCTRHHRQQHDFGIKTFERMYCTSLTMHAILLTMAYDHEPEAA